MRNYDVQLMVETLIEVWSDALARGEKIEIENFLIFELHTIIRRGRLGVLRNGEREVKASATRREVRVRLSKHLKAKFRRT
jgi:nucleoid DNA-binding protein